MEDQVDEATMTDLNVTFDPAWWDRMAAALCEAESWGLGYYDAVRMTCEAMVT